MGKGIRKRDIYDDVFVANTERIFYVKGKWKASMKREIRSMEVGISKVSCDIIFAKYSCRVGESGYCNHIMALLFTSITEEKACTSMARTGVYHQHIHLQNSQSWTQL